jgi:hypothetical protein
LIFFGLQDFLAALAQLKGGNSESINIGKRCLLLGSLERASIAILSAKLAISDWQPQMVQELRMS